MSEQPTLAELSRLLIIGAGQASFAAAEALEHYRDALNSNALARFTGDTVELAADALQSLVHFELEAITAAAASQPKRALARKQLSEQAEALNQLLGAVQRYLDGWVG